MKINDARDLVIDLLEAAIKDNVYVATRFLSGPGMGKTSMVRQAAEIVSKRHGLRVSCKVVRLSEVEQPDVKGYGLAPEVEGLRLAWEAQAAGKLSGEALRAARMQFSLPSWAWDRETDGEYGILFLDEFSQCADDLQKVAAQILLERSVGDYTLPPGVIVIAAGNRESDRSGVRKTMAFVQNRVMDITIEPNKDALVDWMERNNVSPHVVSFVEAHPGIVLKDSVPDKPGPFCTPRSLVMLGTLIGRMSMERFTECAQGLIGEGAGATFVSHLRVIEELPKYADIVADPMKAHLPKDRPDASYAVMQIIAHNVTPDTARAAFKYLGRLGREFQAAGLRSAIKRCPTIAMNAEFGAWLRENKALLEAASVFDGVSKKS